MFQVFNKTEFNDYLFLSRLQDDGFNAHSVGGESHADFCHGEVVAFKHGGYQLLGQSNAILTCDANIFLKTILDVEAQFKYRLFG
jgi:hypothetical protein